MSKHTEKQTTDIAIPVTRFVYNAETGTFTETKPSVKFIKGPIPFDWLKGQFAPRQGRTGRHGIVVLIRSKAIQDCKGNG
jgi:hypothetical protein